MPTTANLLPGYGSFAELQTACAAFADKVNGRIHRETARRPIDRLAEELPLLHPLPAEPHTAALGQTRTVGTDQCIRVGNVRYSTPPGHVGAQVWQHTAGEELVITARTDRGLTEIAWHRVALPGDHQVDDVHYPGHPGHPGHPGLAGPDPAAAASPHRCRGGVPGSGAGGARVADRGRCFRGEQGEGEDG